MITPLVNPKESVPKQRFNENYALASRYRKQFPLTQRVTHTLKGLVLSDVDEVTARYQAATAIVKQHEESGRAEPWKINKNMLKAYRKYPDTARAILANRKELGDKQTRRYLREVGSNRDVYRVLGGPIAGMAGGVSALYTITDILQIPDESAAIPVALALTGMVVAAYYPLFRQSVIDDRIKRLYGPRWQEQS